MFTFLKNFISVTFLILLISSFSLSKRSRILKNFNPSHRHHQQKSMQSVQKAIDSKTIPKLENSSQAALLCYNRVAIATKASLNLNNKLFAEGKIKDIKENIDTLKYFELVDRLGYNESDPCFNPKVFDDAIKITKSKTIKICFSIMRDMFLAKSKMNLEEGAKSSVEDMVFFSNII